MLHWLGYELLEYFGPFRLMKSHLFLFGFGAALAALATWRLLPKFWSRLPADCGKTHAVDGDISRGKPVGAGAIFIPIFVGVCLLVIPIQPQLLQALGLMLLVMLQGIADDRRPGGLSEVHLGLLDLGFAFLGALVLSQLGPVEIWLPIYKEAILLPLWVYLPLATGLIWLTTNATNCSDGVDGVSGSLSAVAFVYLGMVLYAILGHPGVAEYLLLPYYASGAGWATLAFVMAGCLVGYLWHNAPPSQVLMGDAGSRPLGFLMGMLVLATGNPFIIFVVSGVVLVNGATGLLKLALLRFFKIGIFRSVRYPLHDHVRGQLGWSNSQVLVRFVLLQTILTPLLLLFIMKVR